MTVFATSKTVGGEVSEGNTVMTNGVIKFRLGHSDDFTILDIPADYTYSVAETAEDGFDMSVTEGTDTGSITADTTTVVGITNQKTYSEAEDDVSFKVKKVVIGNVIAPAEKFQFVISLSDLRANGIYEVTSNKGESVFVTADANGSAFLELELVDGEILTFTVPQNAEYTVLENAGAYMASYRITDQAGINSITRSADGNSVENKALSTQPETADAGEDIEIVFTNTKQVKQKLTVTKELINASSDNTDLFSFTLNITGLSENTRLPSTIGRLTTEDDGTISIDFSLAGGESIEVYDIPVGASYEVFEDKSDYVASYKIYHGDNGVYSGANQVPNKSLTTGTKSIAANYDPVVVFSNRKVACDITVTKILNATDGTLTSEHRKDEFYFDIEVHELESANRKYNEWIVEYSDINTTGVIKKTLADVLGLEGEEAEAIATDAVFTVMLHHGESFKIKSLPTDATYFVEEQENAAYRFSYIVKANDGAVLQTEARQNMKMRQALPLNEIEIVDDSDRDIEFVFTGSNEFIPYSLPEAGFADQRLMMLMFMIGITVCACLYWYANRKLRR